MDGRAWAEAAGALMIGWTVLAALAWLVYARVHATRALRIILWVYLGISAVAGTFGVLTAASEVFSLNTPLLNLAWALLYFLIGVLFWPFGIPFLVMCTLPSDELTC